MYSPLITGRYRERPISECMNRWPEHNSLKRQSTRKWVSYIYHNYVWIFKDYLLTIKCCVGLKRYYYFFFNAWISELVLGQRWCFSTSISISVSLCCCCWGWWCFRRDDGGGGGVCAACLPATKPPGISPRQYLFTRLQPRYFVDFPSTWNMV